MVCVMQEWAVSGGQKGNFGGKKVSTRLKWVMQEDAPPILPTKKSVQVREFFTSEWWPAEQEIRDGYPPIKTDSGMERGSRKKKWEMLRMREEAQGRDSHEGRHGESGWADEEERWRKSRRQLVWARTRMPEEEEWRRGTKSQENRVEQGKTHARSNRVTPLGTTPAAGETKNPFLSLGRSGTGQSLLVRHPSL